MQDSTVELSLQSKCPQLNPSLDKKHLPKDQIKDKALKVMQTQEDAQKRRITRPLTHDSSYKTY